MLDTDFLRLSWLAWLVYGGDSLAACRAFEQFESTTHINSVELGRILLEGIDISRRTHSWFVGHRRLPLSQFVEEVARAGGHVTSDIAGGWVHPVLTRRRYL
ncbi:hypothetical protein PQR75_46810 [Paraburkholderia fungorum]|uniref:hypothetical protein n=1 Tax=Paraburkholderia fungorum TaxID=134537 RepID=UPI0038B88DE7